MEDIRSELKKRIKNWTVKPVIFVGSGISKRYKNLPDWQTLLTNISQHIFPEDKYYMNRKLSEYENGDKKIYEYIANDLRDAYNKKFFNQEIDIEYQKDYDKLSSKTDPFKFYIAKLINENSYNKCYEVEKEKFQSMKNSISNIITTNYDTILEENFDNFKIKIREEEMLNSRLYNVQELYKIHGCITKPDTIVFTKKDYEELESKQKYLIAKLLTTFIEYPVVFMGYSITDSDINSILKDVKSCLSNENLELLADKMFFINYVSSGKERIHSRIIQDILMTQVDINDFTIIYDALSEVKTKYEVGFLRRISESIAKLMYSEEKNEDRIRVTQIDKANDDDLAILIGSKNSILEIGYCSMHVDNIYEDIFKDNNQYDATLIIEKTLPSIRNKLGNIKKFPLHKFLKSYPKPLDNWLNEKKMRDQKDFFLRKIGSESDIKKYEKRKEFSTINDIKAAYPTKIDTIVSTVFLNAEKFTSEELKEFLLEYWDKTTSKTTIKKIVTIYDYKTYK